jgi:hypothetical protein
MCVNVYIYIYTHTHTSEVVPAESWRRRLFNGSVHIGDLLQAACVYISGIYNVCTYMHVYMHVYIYIHTQDWMERLIRAA